ncbi:MAG: peroxiredoxin [Deltaproteobacteria bacterium HGW-Deltaproteobacteria-6]|jgi:peroxiredoxin|nr:MAG: peroxiredoxin [Deltaproteobacteria bacterium HGW-Deltaproteobacteria-6]
MSRIKVGDVFGDFSLKSHTDVTVDTASIAGKKILLSFHPLAWTEVCAKQMQSLEAHFEVLQSLCTVPLGFSVDSVPCKKAWAKNLGIEKVDLLSDFWPHGGIAARMGIFIDKFGFSERANIILDEQRKAVFVKVYPIRELPDINEVLEFLKK